MNVAAEVWWDDGTVGWHGHVANPFVCVRCLSQRGRNPDHRAILALNIVEHLFSFVKRRE